MKKKVSALLIITLCVAALAASSRIGVGASLISVNSSGMIEGNTGGVRRVRSLAPAIAVEGEIVPFDQFSIILRADIAPFNPSIVSRGETLPLSSDVVAKYSLASLFSLGLGWQMPFSYWAFYDSPFEATVGGVFTLGWLHLNYDTPFLYHKGNELSLGVGFYETGSFYLGTVGFTLSSQQTFSFGDYSKWTRKVTGGGESTNSLYISTPIIFSWDVTLAMSFRFGY